MTDWITEAKALRDAIEENDPDVEDVVRDFDALLARYADYVMVPRNLSEDMRAALICGTTLDDKYAQLLRNATTRTPAPASSEPR